ncbi:serine racemase VanT catalytic subunit [Lacrimispora sp. NSJ-141]|uniref:Alanine racemase n=1 Tax=Lientehia hominis TaxID=2897778 RepID=A0AAP2RLS1_9FIRM|nr:serine racemase VanT catalytic subunit [Lientehia hominis]MCD2493590.1 serine racemase VanT catalytic subunit [Lientehia hominis]
MKGEKAYSGIDGFRIAAALLVAAIHISPLAAWNGTGDFILTRVVARVAVPFFFMTSGFFLAKGTERRMEKLAAFTKATLRLYLISMIFYLPLNLYMGYFNTKLFLPEFLKDILFDGTLYHLWYFPAAIAGAWVSVLLIRRIGCKKAFIAAVCLYAVGLLGDSYYGLSAKAPILKTFYDNVFAVTDYTRNGIFYAPVFFVMGAWTAENEGRRSKRGGLSYFLGFLLMLILMTSEGLILREFGLQRHDSMYILLIPCMYLLFRWLLFFRGRRREMLRDMSMVIYIVHPMMIVVVRMAAKLLSIQTYLTENPMVLYLAVLLLSGLAGILYCRIIREWKKHHPVHLPPEGCRSWVEIDQGCLKYNARILQKNMPQGCRLMAVVKAGAYGHGDAATARCLNQAGVRAFAAATIDEGITLRKEGVQGEILILGYTPPFRAKELRRWRLMQTVCDYEHALALEKMGTNLQVHLAVDSGMHRLGISVDDVNRAAKVFQMKHLKITGIFTHLCATDSSRQQDVEFTERQIGTFFGFLEELSGQGIVLPKIHVQSSYGFLNYPDIDCDYVRAGIILYGADSRTDTCVRRKLDLRPALALKSTIASVKKVYAGESVGYDRAYTAPSDRDIAVVAIGYADGYPRSLSCGKGSVLIKGRRAPIVGRICMDQMMIDVTGIPGISAGDTVTLIGKDGEEEIPASEAAEQAGSISNELLSRLGGRLTYLS